jgi:hypothetical protein
MWQWSLGWGEITPNLVIGSCPMTPADIRRICHEAEVSALLSLQSDACLAWARIDYGEMERAGSALGLIMMRSPMRDLDVVEQRLRLADAVRALFALCAAGHRVYLHCTAGLGRAPLTALAYLTWIEEWNPEQAIQRIIEGRPGAVPSWEAYHGSWADLVVRHRDAIARRAYELHRQGAHGDALLDWYTAEREILRAALTMPQAPPRT